MKKNDRQKELERFKIWLENKGLRVAPTRFGKYTKLFEKYSAEELVGDLSPEEYDEYVFILREVDELLWIWKGIQCQEPPGLEERIKNALGGETTSREDSSELARNTMVELRIASYFMQGGYSVDLAGKADVGVKVGRKEIVYVECKRPSSKKKVIKRAREGVKQLKERFKSSKRKAFGILMFDVGRILHPEQGLSIGLTQNQMKFEIQKQLLEFSENFKINEVCDLEKRIISVWIQLSVPTLNLEEGIAQSRFSSLHIPLVDFYGKNTQSKIFRKISHVWEVIN